MKNIINRIKNDKLLFFLSILIIGLFLVLIIRITYSYLAASINEAKGNVSVNSGKTDVLKFIEGETLVLNATPTTLPEGGGNFSKSTTYGASLLANNTNNTANYTYYVYFNIPTNTINYIEENTPEVILTIKQGETDITNIEGLTYGTFNGVSGFDITNKSGLFTVASDYVITSNSSESATIQNWTFTLTYLNQGFDQSANYGNSMNVEIIMSKEEQETSITLADYIISTYTDGSNGLYYHDVNLENGAEDNSYRYSGANPNNYVCFGSDAETCPEDNLYRIIGVFGSEVKLIKSTSYGNYEWNSGDDNTWSTSDIKNTLNSTYLSSLSSTWQNKIAMHTWKVGGMSYSDIYTAKQYYDKEVGSSSSNITDSMKIGLMYVSDYGYAARNSYWTSSLYNYDGGAYNNDWLYLGDFEWTISPNSSYSDGVFLLDGYGSLYLSSANFGYAARPVFYLNSNITYVSGDGSQSNPFRIN